MQGTLAQAARVLWENLLIFFQNRFRLLHNGLLVGCSVENGNNIFVEVRAVKAPILIADDDDNDVLLMKRALTRARVINPTYVVSTGEDAIRYLCGEGEYSDRTRFPFPVLLLLNLQLPGRNGGEVLGWLQTKPELPPLKIVVVSGSTDPRPVQQAMDLGARWFIRKPPSADKLIAIFNEMKDLRLVPSSDGVRLELAAFMAAALIN